MAQDGEDVGPLQHHGGVRPVWRHGAPLAAASGDDTQERQGRGHGLMCTVASQ